MQISNMWPAKLNMLNPREDVNKKSAEGQERWSKICLPIKNKCQRQIYSFKQEAGNEQDQFHSLYIVLSVRQGA